jgi:hypothetical protein
MSHLSIGLPGTTPSIKRPSNHPPTPTNLPSQPKQPNYKLETCKLATCPACPASQCSWSVKRVRDTNRRSLTSTRQHPQSKPSVTLNVLVVPGADSAGVGQQSLFFSFSSRSDTRTNGFQLWRQIESTHSLPERKKAPVSASRVR